MRDKSPAGVRDAAMLAVSFTAGLRLAELVGLDLDTYNDHDGSIRLVGKGNKERTAYMQNGGLYALRAWLTLRGLDEGAMFCPINKSGKITLKHMTGRSVYNRFQKRAEEAGLAAFSPHDGRRTWIGNP